jgi:hypothetical protein
MTTQGAPAAAEIAHAMSECYNLLFLYAAPRVFASVRGTGAVGLDDADALASLRRFLRTANGIRSRAPKDSADVDRLVQAAILVEEIAGTLDAHRASKPRDGALPAPVVERARRALSILGVAEPSGGWDAFEGFTVPYPPPSPKG